MDTVTSPSSTRVVLLALVVVAGALTAGTIVQRDRALEKAYEDAQGRAELYAATTVSSALVASDFAGPIGEPRLTQFLGEIEEGVLTDPAVARVRLWAPDGTLLFSTDRADEVGEVVEEPAIQVAMRRGTGTRGNVEPVSTGTDRSDPTPTALLQTFAPLTLGGMTEPGAVVEIEQFASALEDRADDPWGVLQLGATVATALLAVLAFVALIRGSRRRGVDPTRARRASGWDPTEGDPDGRLEQAVARAREAEASAATYAAQLQAVTARLESLEGRSPDERTQELREALRRSEAERAMLRSGRPETVLEAELRQLRTALQDARSRAKAAEALVAGKGDLSAVQEQLSTAEREMERALERARIAEGRADAAEEQGRLTGELTTAAEQRIDILEAKLQEVASSGSLAAQDGSELAALREELAAATERASMLERRAANAETTAAALADAAGAASGAEEVLGALEERVAAAEARASKAEQRLGAFEGEEAEHGSSFRHTLGVRAAGRKLAAPAAQAVEEAELEPETALREAIARGLRGPLTRAAGLTLSLQGTVGSSEGRAVLRQLSSSLRRLDQLAADLHDVRKIHEGTLPIARRRTDVTALLTTTLEEADQLQEDRLVRLDAERLQATVDPVRLRQVVEGMLEGARERTRAGAAIVVRARTSLDGVWIGVEDDNRTPATIGPEMSLAARLAELLGTELVAEGSGFHLVLPPDGDA
jgi:hypothetical protein